MASDLKQRAVKSAGWLGVGQVASQAMSVCVTGVLARLLMPRAFGLVGMVAVFTAFLELFQELGLSSAVIQRQDATEEQLSTVFFITVACGAVLSGLTVLASPFIAAFYGEPSLVPIAIAVGANFFIHSFVHVHGALLRKALDFRKLVLIRIIGRLSAGAMAIVLALLGFGVYALVFQSVAGALIFATAVWFTVPWRPSARPRLRSVGSMIRFGANVTGTAFLAYLGRNMGYLLIGRFLGSASLGIYALAYQIMLLPMRRVTSQISQVAFPAFSSVQHDKARVRRGFVQMTGMIALVTFPAMMGLLIVAPEAVRVVLGEKWLRVTLLVQVLSMAGALQSVSWTTAHVFRSQGRADLHFRLVLVATPITLASFVIGLRWDVEGVAVCYAISRLLVVPLYFYFAFKLIRLPFRQFYQGISGPLRASLSMAVVVLVCRMLATHLFHIPMLALLCIQVTAGVAAYAVALRVMAPGTYGNIIGLVRLALARGEKSEEASVAR